MNNSLWSHGSWKWIVQWTCIKWFWRGTKWRRRVPFTDIQYQIKYKYEMIAHGCDVMEIKKLVWNDSTWYHVTQLCQTPLYLFMPSFIHIIGSKTSSTWCIICSRPSIYTTCCKALNTECGCRQYIHCQIYLGNSTVYILLVSTSIYHIMCCNIYFHLYIKLIQICIYCLLQYLMLHNSLYIVDPVPFF
jgi:hypothetical protein